VPDAWTKISMGLEPTHLLGVLQQAAAHTRLAEVSRPNQEVPKQAHAQPSREQDISHYQNTPFQQICWI
jgi:hypothetical protein